jgi:hypothetical protein
MAVEQPGAEAAHPDDAPPGPEGKTEDDLDDLKRRFREALDRKAQRTPAGYTARTAPPSAAARSAARAAANAAQPSAATGTARNQLRSSVR